MAPVCYSAVTTFLAHRSVTAESGQTDSPLVFGFLFKDRNKTLSHFQTDWELDQSRWPQVLTGPSWMCRGCSRLVG